MALTERITPQTYSNQYKIKDLEQELSNLMQHYGLQR